MFKHNDYILDQIEMLGDFLRTVFNQESEPIAQVFNEDGSFSATNFLKYRLKKMLLEGQINEAENILFDEIKKSPEYSYLDVALYFYKELLKLDKKTLIKQGFSEQEIVEGLNDIKKIYKVINE